MSSFRDDAKHRTRNPSGLRRCGGMDSGLAPSGAPRNDGGRPYFALSILVTVYPDAASSASKVTLSPTFTCFSIAGSLTR